jgi:hypothetical protein
VINTARTFTGPRDKACYDEATRDPIFMLQRRIWRLTDEPDGYKDVEGNGYYPEDAKINEDGEYDVAPLTMEQLEEMGCAVQHWETDGAHGVWLSREEAEEYGRLHAYNYPEGWQVYCVCAGGQLAKMLKAHGDEFWPAPPAMVQDLTGSAIERDALACMRHAVGFPTGGRNHYCTHPLREQGLAMEHAVERGWAFRGRPPSELSGGDQYYHVTDLGRRVLLHVAAMEAAKAAVA